ncbi:zdhhc7 [Symbiodinium sp. CCMP2592]|nr:zdhhc7 [Symbiodinium sp. CCMP2592]
MVFVQIPIISQLHALPQALLIGIEVGLSVATVALMGYCGLADPGQAQSGLDLEQGHVPPRAHKSWLYTREIRRYDHYCKWVKNVIGLLNHREFVVMLIGLTSSGVLGLAVDTYLALVMAFKVPWQTCMILLHLAFCIALLAIEVPMLQIHIGLISRNELAYEWVSKINYVAFNTTQGDGIPVGVLDVEEYNELFDEFVYDRERNPWDHGRSVNCWNFWCWPRWPADETGEF